MTSRISQGAWPVVAGLGLSLLACVGLAQDADSATAEEAAAPPAKPLVVEFEYAEVRQEILVAEESEFHVITNTERGKLLASGKVGRVSDGHVDLVLRVRFDGHERGAHGISIRPRVRLGEFTGGIGTLPMGYTLEYVWVRRGVDPVPTLVEALRRGGAKALVAARQLGRLQAAASGAVPDLIAVLKLKELVELREAAAVALGQIGPAAQGAVQVLARQLDNEQPAVLRVAAAAALWRIAKHPDATPTLLAAVREPEKEVRLKALEALREMGVEAPTAGPALRAALKDNDPQIRAAVAAALWAATRDTLAVDALMAMLEDDESGRSYAIEALGTIGYPGAHPATNEVATEAFSSHSGHRWYVANALKQIDPDGSQCAAEVARILRFVKGDGVKEASEVLAQFGSTLLPRLRELLDSENEHDRQFAFRTLWRIGTPAVDTLAEALRHRNVEVRRLAGSWLRALDAKAAPAIPDLVRALEDEDKEVRINASHALIDIGPAAVPAVRQTMDGASERTRELVKWILSDIAAWHRTKE